MRSRQKDVRRMSKLIMRRHRASSFVLIGLVQNLLALEVGVELDLVQPELQFFFAQVFHRVLLLLL